MQYCGQIFEDSFETYKTILRRIFTEFNRKVNFQNHLFGLIRFEIMFYLQHRLSFYLQESII